MILGVSAITDLLLPFLRSRAPWPHQALARARHLPTRIIVKTNSTTLGSALLLALLGTSCNSDDKKPASATAQNPGMLSTKQGEAGGTYEETVKASAKVTAINHKTLEITLKTEDGRKVEFTAPPEVR